MNIQPVTTEDLNICKQWWIDQGWGEFPTSVLPPTGFMCYIEDKPVAATWIMTTNSSFYFIEWTVGNPAIKWGKRKEAIDTLIDYCCDWIKEDGGEIAFTMTKNKRLIEKFESNGFVTSDTEMTHMLRRV